MRQMQTVTVKSEVFRLLGCPWVTGSRHFGGEKTYCIHSQKTKCIENKCLQRARNRQLHRRANLRIRTSKSFTLSTVSLIQLKLNFLTGRFNSTAPIKNHTQIQKHKQQQTPTRHPTTIITKRKGKPVPLKAWSGPEGSRKLRFPDFMTTAQELPYINYQFDALIIIYS